MSEVNPVSPDDVIVEVRQVMSEVNPMSPVLSDDVIVEGRQVMRDPSFIHFT